jgi:hypothetical protein
VLSTAHLFLGGALGALLRRPAAAAAAGVVSHHLADCVLHTDTGTYRTGAADEPRYSHVELAVAATDLLIGLALLYRVAREHPRRAAVVIGALAGITPDLIDNAPVIAPRFRSTAFGRRYHAMHNRLHWTARPSQSLPGVATQVVVVLIGAALLRR